MANQSRASKKPSAPNKAFVRKDPKRWKHAGWTSVPNSLVRDPDLPPAEFWAWSWLASNTETFEVSGDALWKANKHVGKNKAYELLHNLEERGLLLRHHEVDERGVPYIVYDLQPVPVPSEQRTAKPRKPRKKKQLPEDGVQAAGKQVRTGSHPSGNPGTTRNNATSKASSNDGDGFPPVRESGNDQEQRHNPDVESGSTEGEVSPGRVFPTRPGESYKEEKTNTEDQPTKTGHDRNTFATSAASSGWLEDASTAKSRLPDTPGAHFLAQLAFKDGTGFGAAAVLDLHDHVTALIESGWTEGNITSEITDAAGAGQVRSWPAFARPKLEALRPIRAAAPAATMTVLPEWCELCEEGPRVTRDGKKCRSCHPKFAHTAA